MRCIDCFLFVLAVTAVPSDCLLAAETSPGATPAEAEIRAAAERALPLLERASAGSADQRKCFTCHSQALPVLAIVESQRRGFSANSENLKRQVQHTHQHLSRGRKSYQEGKGQGGGVDTAGYALWALQEAAWPKDEVTTLVSIWLDSKQHKKGYWKCSSNRPPSEASDVTTTYLALRALAAYGVHDDEAGFERAKSIAADWLAETQAKDTEDQVFRLLSLAYVDLPDKVFDDALERLQRAQRDDGGWSQKDGMESDAYATGTALYALNVAGGIGPQDKQWQKGIRYLLDHQLEDGSWLVKSRSKPFQVYFETGFPHAEDQFISTTATSWATLALLLSLPEKPVPEIQSLPGTKTLDWPEEDLSARLMRDAHRFVESQIDQTAESRTAVRGDSDAGESRRTELRKILGVVEDRLPPRMEHFGDELNPAIVGQTQTYQVFQVRWPVFANVVGEGLLIKQKAMPVGRVVVIPDADQSPEDMLGLRTVDDMGRTTPAEAIGRRLADSGFEVVIPAIVSRLPLQVDDSRRSRAEYTEREWIYRQAFHMGRHVIGYDLQRVLAAVDWFDAKDSSDCKIGVVGFGEGGLVALHAAAIDRRIDAALVSGYFNQSDSVWSEPIYRNVWSRLEHFGNAEVASLIAPRQIVLEHSEFPEVAGHKGELKTPTFETVSKEFRRIRDRSQYCKLVAGLDGATTGPWSDDAVEQFTSCFGLERTAPYPNDELVDRRASAQQWIRDRTTRTRNQLETHVQSLVRASEHVRDQFFLFQAMPEFLDSHWSTERQHPTFDPDKFITAAASYREQFDHQLMGRFDATFLPPNARTRRIVATDKWTAYDVVLDVYEGLFSWGVMVVPNELQPGEQRPVVVCQHGRNGVPRDTIDQNKSAYNDFAARLAERGFVTFAPHNLYRGEDRYRWLDRKANTIGCTLFSIIIAQHDATLRWLASLPFVDGQRIAFYGLSYGGESAVRLPAALPQYCLSICSGDFNQWTRKVAATDQPFSFMNTIEWEMPYWNLGHTFDYAEMAYLIFPRPFMVERGHHDRVARDRWVAHEFAKVRWLYAQFGMDDRVQIEFFQGGHSINGRGTFEFLHEQLDWPAKTRTESPTRADN